MFNVHNKITYSRTKVANIPSNLQSYDKLFWAIPWHAHFIKDLFTIL